MLYIHISINEHRWCSAIINNTEHVINRSAQGKHEYSGCLITLLPAEPGSLSSLWEFEFDVAKLLLVQVPFL